MSVVQGAAGKVQEAATQVILVHDLAAVHPEVLKQAESEVTRIFSLANVRIEWLHCSTHVGESGELSSCPAHPAGTIILRIVPAIPDSLGASALGYALTPGVDGLYATISFPRVQVCVAHQTASAAGLPQVLGHAMAHEIGHILLGTNSHSDAGLMQQNWNARALNDASKGCLNFSREEVKRIQDGVVLRAGLR
jgi:hypothetical protein